MSKSKRFALSLSSWFCVPEQGMRDMEILCRASAFLVRSKDPQFKHRYHVLTASHVVAPWRFPKYYPDEWLQFVNEKHTHYTVELRHEDGVFMTQSELLPAAVHHASRDLAVLHLENESTVNDLLKNLGFEAADLRDAQLVPGEAVDFHGHEVVAPSSFGTGGNGNGSGSSGSADGEAMDARHPVPRIVSGTYELETAHQAFARTKSLLTYGMCGGPVISRAGSGTGRRGGGASSGGGSSSGGNGNIDGVCGLLEGIVPVNHPARELQGLASIVDSRQIAAFLDDVEAGADALAAKGHVALVGGEAALHVGSDDDPKKGLEALMKKFEE